MTFLQPMWWWLALPAIAWVLWLHSRRRRRLIVPSLHGWAAASGPIEANVQRIQPVPSWALAIQLLAILASVGALAQPRIGAAGDEATRVVVVVGVADPGEVRAAVRAEAGAWPPEGRVTVVDARGRVRPISVDVAAHRLDAVLGEVLVRDEAAPRWADAAALAGAIVDERTLVLVLAPPDAEAAALARLESHLPANLTARVRATGAPGPLVGIVGAAVEARAFGGHRAVVRLAVRAPDLGDLQIEALQGERVVGSTVLRAPEIGNERLTVVLEGLDASLIELRVAGVGLDDGGASVWRPSPLAVPELDLSVLLVGPAWPRLDAFLAATGVRVVRADAPPADAADYDLVVLSGVHADAPTGIHTVRFGAPPPGTTAEVATGPWSATFGPHDVFLPAASVQTVDVPSVLALPILPGADVLAWADAHPVVQARTVDGRAELVFGFPAEPGSWTEADAPYVVLGRLLRWIEPALGSPVDPTCRVGVPCALPNLGGVGAWNVRAPNGAETRAGPAWTQGASSIGWHAWFVPRAAGWHDAVGPSAARRVWVDPDVPEARAEDGASVAMSSLEGESRRAAWMTWPWLRALATLALLGSLGAAWGREGVRRWHDRSRAPQLAVVLGAALLGVASVLAVVSAPWPRGWSTVQTVVVEALVPENAAWAPLYRAWSSGLDVQGERRDVAVEAPERVAWAEDAAVPERDERVASGTVAALEWAAAMLADVPVAQVVVPLSGISTSPELGRALEGVAARAAVSVVQLPRYAASDEVIVQGAWVLGTAGAGGTARAVFQIEAASSRDVVLHVLRDGEPWFETAAALPPGRSTVTFDAPTPTDAATRFELRLASRAGPGDAVDWAGIVVPALPAGRVAVVSDEVAWPLLFVQLLEVQGFDVTLLDPVDAPATAAGWTAFDTVVLFDLPAIALVTRQQAALEAWVAEYGGGLVLLGGERAFGPGGYHLTELDALSPLASEIPMDRPDVAIVFVLDRSGSMLQAVGASNRLEIAREATWAAVQLLDPRSMMGIVVFDSASTLIHPLRAVEDLAGVRRSLDLLTAGGGTNLQPALEQAHLALLGAGDVQKHMVVMTDGLTQGADFDPVLEALVADGVTVSTIAVGQGAAYPRLQQIANLTGGVFYESIDFELLPSIMAQEVLLLTSEAVRREPSRVVFEGVEPPFLEGITATWPAVGGVVRTTARPEATVHASLPDGEPVLASWRYGTGRVVAWTSEGVGPWTLDWIGEPDFPRLWGQVVRWTGSFAARPGLRPVVVVSENTVQLDVQASDALGNPIAGRRLAVEWVGTGGDGIERVLREELVEVEAGRYRADGQGFVGPVVATVRAEEGEGLEAVVVESYVPAAAAQVGTPGQLQPLAASVGAAYGDVGAVDLARNDRAWSNQLDPAWRPWLVVALLAWLVSLTLRYHSGRAGTRALP